VNNSLIIRFFLETAAGWTYQWMDISNFWLADPAFLLRERKIFAQSIEEIVKLTRDGNIDNAIAIFLGGRY
jgi:hypothetical protein